MSSRPLPMRGPGRLLGWCVVVLGLAAGCSSVPGTGRQRVNFMPSGQMNRLGEETFDTLLASKTTLDTGPAAAMVRRVGSRVVESARTLYPDGDLPSHWEIVLIDDETPNAFALPGGRIGVHTGMVDLAGGEDGLGIVLGHEVGHVLAAHSAERMSHGLLIVGGLAIGSTALEDEDEATRARIIGALGAGATIGITLPYSRLHETEADELGLMIAANAGFDPRQAIPLWQRMARQGGQRMEFLSTHPVPQTRIEEFKRLMPKAIALYEQSRTR
ncbi:MAG: M48 family metallopeptidase [Phycisphaerales bacterium]|nr:M48 family metallopeptidase [Phycisphaerales bacterium]